VILGVGVLGEHFGAGTGIGFVLILAGSYLATRSATVRQAPAKRERQGAGGDADDRRAVSDDRRAVSDDRRAVSDDRRAVSDDQRRDQRSRLERMTTGTITPR